MRHARREREARYEGQGAPSNRVCQQRRACLREQIDCRSQQVEVSRRVRQRAHSRLVRGGGGVDGGGVLGGERTQLRDVLLIRPFPADLLTSREGIVLAHEGVDGTIGAGNALMIVQRNHSLMADWYALPILPPLMTHGMPCPSNIPW